MLDYTCDEPDEPERSRFKPEFSHWPNSSTFRRYVDACEFYDLTVQSGAQPQEIGRRARIAINLLFKMTAESPLAAIQRGPCANPINLPRFFRNASGIEDPADPALIAEMAAARGQTLDPE